MVQETEAPMYTEDLWEWGVDMVEVPQQLKELPRKYQITQEEIGISNLPSLVGDLKSKDAERVAKASGQVTRATFILLNLMRRESGLGLSDKYPHEWSPLELQGDSTLPTNLGNPQRLSRQQVGFGAATRAKAKHAQPGGLFRSVVYETKDRYEEVGSQRIFKEGVANILVFLEKAVYFDELSITQDNKERVLSNPIREKGREILKFVDELGLTD